MDESTLSSASNELLKAFGHKSRTLVNGVTGPVQMIRSLSDEPQLIEPLRMLELSVARFEKFTSRALFVSDLINGRVTKKNEYIDLNEMIKYIILDLSDFSDFFNVEIELTENNSNLHINSDFNLFNNALYVLLEHSISLNNQNSNINVLISESESVKRVEISCVDNGFVNKSLAPIFHNANKYDDIDLFLLKLCIDLLGVNIDFRQNENQNSIITLDIT